MMRYAISVVCYAIIVILLILPARAELLQGSVQSDAEESTLSEDPALVLDWTNWRRDVAVEIHRRMKYLISTHYVPYVAGSCIVRYSVYRNGKVSVRVLSDTSIGLDQIVVEAVKSMKGNPILRFPERSQRKFAFQDTNYSISNCDSVSYLANDREVIKN